MAWGETMKPHRSSAFLFLFAATAAAQPALIEQPDFPGVQPGPMAVYSGDGCFLLAEGVILPGDVDWVRVRLPRASSRTVVDVDFATGPGASAMLAIVAGGTTGFNIGDNNNARDALCGLSATSDPVGDPQDSVVDLRETSLNATINIAVSGASDTSFVGLHSQFFTYQVWVYAEPLPCVNDASCDDGVDCTVDDCDVASGDCTNTADDSVCDDGLFCNGLEYCDAVADCRSTPPPDCDDGVDCTDDYCDTVMDECVSEAFDGLCDNGVFCDGEETCDPQMGCQAGEAVDCDDGIECTADACDEENWVCLHAAMDDACDDGLFCNGQESCDAEAGCMAGDDPCPNSQCRESDDRCVGCVSNAECDDGVYCNGYEQCNSLGACVAGSYPCGDAFCRESDDQCVECMGNSDCNDGVFCNGVEVCNSAGQCSSGDYPCGEELCRESDDRCVECLGNSDCDDGEFCNGLELCNPAGSCADGAAPCEGEKCREDDDRCVECLADEECDDAAFCNGSEFCDEDGKCNPGDKPCGEDLCREDDELCVECLEDSDCKDELFCNGVEKCSAAGVCQPGSNPCGSGQTCNENDDRCVSAGFSLDIRPGVCPARVQPNLRGSVPMAVVGTDVKLVNLKSLRLVRVDGVGKFVEPEMAPKGQAPYFADVCGPNLSCQCSANGPDGMADLVLNFKIEKMVSALKLDKVRNGGKLELRIQGKLKDGRSFVATDCITVQNGGRNGTGAAP